MGSDERIRKVAEAWSRAYDEVATVYGNDGPELYAVRAQAPGLALRIEEAESAAEDASVTWQHGGPGGVQAKIDTWRDLWIEAIRLVRDGREAA